MMRLILTTIILTMLAQPVWAMREHSENCRTIQFEGHLSIDVMNRAYSIIFSLNNQKRWEGPLSPSELGELEKWQKTYDQQLDSASKLANIYNAFCKD